MTDIKRKNNPFMQTMPFVMAGSLTLGLNTVAAAPAADATLPDEKKQNHDAKATVEALTKVDENTYDTGATSVQSTPLTYTVKRGDTVSAIASKHGLSTANVLALNGLGWSSLIFPGQKLILNKSTAPIPNEKPPAANPPAASPGKATTYTVKSGDTVSGIASKFGVTTQSVLTANGLKMSSIIYPKQVLKIPGVSTPAPKPEVKPTPAPKPTPPANTSPTTYTVKSGDTVSGIASKFGVTTQSVLTANGLKMSSIIYPKQVLKIPSTTSTAPAPTPDPKPNPTPPVGTVPESGGGSTVTPAPDSCTAVTYTIKSGDTVSGIASTFGVTIASILEANGLQMNSLIFAGQKLLVPGAKSLTDDCVVHAEMTAEMRSNAQIIVNVGRDAGVPEYGLVIALATAMQESSLRNLSYGDRDSVGLFQQRPSTGWGTVEQIMDPVRSAKAFFGGPVNPNPGKTRGLLDIPGWQTMPLTKAAQAVQISGFPDAYAKWEGAARYWLSQLD